MKFKLDENIGSRGRDLLQKESHDVSTVSLQSMEGASDELIIEICRLENRCLVTLDLDFSNPIVFPPTRYAGIVVLRLPVNFRLHDILNLLQTFLSAINQETDLSGKLWIVGGGKIREYTPKLE